MITPWDGMVVGDKSDPIEFVGYHLDEGALVQLQVYNPATEHFDGLGLAVADADMMAGSGETLWGWFEMGIVIPESYWLEDSCEGAYARLRSRDTDTGRNMLSVRDDWYSCWGDVEGNVGAYVARCTSDRGSEAWIQTEDFVEHAPSIGPQFEERVKRSRRDHTFHLRPEVSPARYDRLQMRLEVDGISEEVECAYEPCHGPWTWTCEVNTETSAFAGHFEGDKELGKALHERGTIEFRGLDQLSCSNGNRWTEWAAAPGWYYSGDRLCAPDPEPDPPAAPLPTYTTWELQCLCQTAYGLGLIDMNMCMAAEDGAEFTCTYLENDFEAIYGTPIECELVSYTDTGTTGCTRGRREITNVEVEIPEEE